MFVHTHTHTCDRPRHLELSIYTYWLNRGKLLLYTFPGALKLPVEEEEEEEVLKMVKQLPLPDQLNHLSSAYQNGILQ